MATHPLDYTEYTVLACPAFPNGRVAPRPILKLTLVNGVHRLTCYAIIDSGADHCVFPRSFMQPLGLDALQCPVELTTGVGASNVPTHFVNLSINLQDVIEYPAYVGFTSGLEDFGVGLLGQVGFFDRFNVGFSLREKKCYIEVPDPPQNS